VVLQELQVQQVLMDLQIYLKHQELQVQVVLMVLLE
jgi:hypothetical protein